MISDVFDGLARDVPGDKSAKISKRASLIPLTHAAFIMLYMNPPTEFETGSCNACQGFVYGWL